MYPFFELLSTHTDLDVLGDKGYINTPKATELWEKNRIQFRTFPRANQKQQVSTQNKHFHNAIQQLIETVNSQLSGQLGIEKNNPHTLYIYLNRLLGKSDLLQTKAGFSQLA